MKFSSLSRIIATCVLILISAASGAVAQEIPDTLPIDSLASLESYCRSNAKSGYKGVWGTKILNSAGSVTNVPVTGKNADEVLRNLSKPGNSFKFKVTDATKPVYVYGGVSDANGLPLFETWSVPVTLEADSNGMKFSAALEFRMAMWTCVEAPEDTIYAVIQYEEGGKEWQVEVKIINGKLQFPVEYAGKQGVLLLTISRSGSPSFQVAYNLASGTRIPGVSTSGDTTTTLQNHIYASDRAMGTSGTLSAVGYMLPPTVSWWESVSAPSVTFNVNVRAGNQRVCTARFIIRNAKLATLGTIKAFARDSLHPDADGTIEEIESFVINKSASGADVIIDVSWPLRNDADEAEGTDWDCFLEIDAYEKQRQPSEPYYGPGVGLAEG